MRKGENALGFLRLTGVLLELIPSDSPYFPFSSIWFCFLIFVFKSKI